MTHREERVSPIQRVVAVNRSPIHDVHSFPNTPHAAEGGSSVQGHLALHVIRPGHVLLPPRPPPVTSGVEGPAGSAPALVDKGRTLLLVMLLPVGYAADGAVGGAFVGVLIWKLLLLPVASVPGQGAAEAASQGTRRRQRDRVEGLLCGNRHGDGEELLVCLTQ